MLRAGAIMSTRMACENNNLEDRALPVMAKPMTITESGDRLTLSNSAGTIELTRAR
jgi:heat shock protein HslJ